MRPIAGVQDDWASVIQAYVEITQTMTSAHDILVSLAHIFFRKGPLLTRPPSTHSIQVETEQLRWSELESTTSILTSLVSAPLAQIIPFLDTLLTAHVQ